MILGYILCSAFYLALAGMGISVWSRRLAGSSLIPAFAAQSAWSLVLSASAAGIAVPFTALLAAEYVHFMAWALVLAKCLTVSSHTRWRRSTLGTLSMVSAVILVGLTSCALLGRPRISSTGLVHVWMWGGLACSLTGLVLLEQVARNTVRAHEWRLRYLWLAVGAILAWDAWLYSVALTHGKIPETLWMARGFVDALIAGLIVLALRRIRRWQSVTFLSPRLVFFNATLLGASLYLLAMAAASYFVREMGGSWGAAAQAVFVAGAVVVLAVAVLSEQFRANVRVTVAKHVFPYRYDYRRVWRQLTRALSEPADADFHERIGSVIAESLNCASSGLWLKGADDRLVPVGGTLAPRDGPAVSVSAQLCEYLREHEWIYDLEQPLTSGSGPPRPAPPASLVADSRIWLIVPLSSKEGLVGLLALGQPLATMRLTWEEIDLLRAAGRQIASYLAWETAAKRLAESRQFETLSRLSTVIMHDLRHLVAQQALVVENAARHRRDPDFFDDAILTIDNSVKRMSRLMEELRAGVASEPERWATRVDVAAVCAEAVKRNAGRKPAPSLELADRGLEIIANRDRMVHALEHIVRNGQEAAPHGSVRVRLRRSATQALIEVEDTGTGMDADFIRNRLFRPFDSTRGHSGMGIGAYQAREFAQACGGTLTVESELDRGTRFTFALPLAGRRHPETLQVSNELQAS